jgi:hypothetical protein
MSGGISYGGTVFLVLLVSIVGLLFFRFFCREKVAVVWSSSASISFRGVPAFVLLAIVTLFSTIERDATI